MALDAKTGNSLWQSQAPMAAMSRPVLSGGLVFVQGGYDCRTPSSVLAAFNAKTGDVIWRAPTTANRYGYSLCGSEFPPPVGSGIVLTIGGTQTASPAGVQSVVRGLDPRTGRELWKTEGEEPAAGAGVALVLVRAPSGAFRVRGLDPLTGQQKWEATVDTVNIAPSVSGRVVLVQGYGCPTSCTGPGQAGASVSGLDPATGSQMWQVRFGQGSQLTRRPLLGDVAVFSFYVETPPPPGQPPSSAPPAGAIGALDPANGTELWRQSVSTEVGIPTLAVPGTVYVQQSKPSNAQQCPATRLDALDSKSGNLRWRVKDVQACQSVLAADGPTTVLAAASLSGPKIVVLDAATGTMLWEKPITTSGPFPLVQATVSGGVVYVAASGRFIAPPPGD